jgi:hypothetical protein
VKKSKYASQNAVTTANPSGDDHLGAESADPLAKADGDQGLADGDDHDQPVTLGEVRRLHAPAARPKNKWHEVGDGERGQPEDRLESAVDEPGDDDQSNAYEGGRSDAQNRREQVRVTTC